MESASDAGCAALREVERCLSALPEGTERAEILTARDELEKRLEEWTKAVEPMPSDLCSRLHELSEEALDIQRDLTLERRRMHRVPEDFDSGQIEWFRAGMEESVRERPDGWRIVYLHHPLYSTIANHCERPDILGVR